MDVRTDWFISFLWELFQMSQQITLYINDNHVYMYIASISYIVQHRHVPLKINTKHNRNISLC